MRNIKWIYPFIVMGFVITLLSSCKKDDKENINPTPATVTDIDGNFIALTEMGSWWTADMDNTENAWLIIMSNNNAGLSGWVNMDKFIGASVRCTKNK
jgi:hypothetical protein